jgi:alkylhydroperoxidase family enzyme
MLIEIRNQVAGGRVANPSPLLAAYLDKVRFRACDVTDEDVAGLVASGLTEDEVYEATMYTALTAGIDRFDIALRALREAT